MPFEQPIFESGSLFIKPDFVPKLAEVDFDWNPEDARINFPLSANADLEMEVGLPITARTSAVIDLAQTCDMSYSLQLSEPYQEQIRRHKKKRINKKWAKRYGYRLKWKNLRFSEVSLVPKGHGYEFTTNHMPMIVR